MNKKRDRVITVRSVIKYILNHIWIVVGCLVCGTISLVGLNYLMNRNNNVSDETQIDLEEMHKGFSEEEKAKVSYAVYSYDQLKEIDSYINNSLKMEIDPYTVNITSAQYVIEVGEMDNLSVDERQELTSKLMMSYVLYVEHGGLAADIYEGEKDKLDITEEELMEIIYISYNSNLDSNSTFAVGTYVGDIKPELQAIVEKYIEKYAVSAQGIAKHKLKLVRSFEVEKRLESLYNSQRSMYTEREAIVVRLSNAVSDLSGDTLVYYEEYIEQSSAIDGVADNDEIATTNQKISMRTLLKYGIVGGVLGVCGACGILLFMFMFSKTIISEDDYIASMGLKYLRKVKESNLDEDIDFVVAKVKLMCSKAKVNRLAIVSSDFEGVASKLTKELSNKLSQQDIELINVENVMRDCVDMNNLFEVGSCIFIEKIGVSKYNEVCEIVELCEENNINIMGVVDVA